MTFKKGQSGNPSGRAKGIVDKRMRLNQQIRDGIGPVIAKLQELALGGDTAAAAILMSRGIAPLRAESDDRVEFEFDAAKPVSDQLLQVATAVASGGMTLEQGQKFAEILSRIATVRALNQGGDSEAALVQAFKEMATSLGASGKG